MSSPEHGHQEGPEQVFINDTMRAFAEESLVVLSEVFLGDYGRDISERVVINIDETSDVGNIIPTVGYDTDNESLMITIEPSNIIQFAEKVLEESEARGRIGVSDIVKLLVGAGAARAVLAWRKMELEQADQSEKGQFIDRICDKRYLWEEAASYDDIHGTSLRRGVERLGDDQIPAINVLRFVFGASINHLSDVLDLQVEIPNLFRPLLVEEEQSREADLKYNSAIFDIETAFIFYDRSAPQLMYALSFPMNPNEELTSIFAERI